MPNFLHIPPIHASSKRNQLRFSNDNWMNSAWNNFELSSSYMHEVGTFDLLSAEDEAKCSQEYNEARNQVLRMLFSFPQVIMLQIAKLLELPGAQIFNHVELELSDDDDLSVSEDALEKRLRSALQAILDDQQEYIQRFLSKPMRKFVQSQSLTQESSELLTQVFQPLVKQYGELVFQTCFYEACVEFFIHGDWKAPEITMERRLELVQEMQQANDRAVYAMTRLVEGNLRLVISIARHFSCSLMPLSDLVQEGNIGLMRAVETFEAERGYRFATYASYWIRQAITHAMNINGRSIRIPVNIVRQLSRLHRLEREYLQEHGRPPTMEELAGLAELSVPRVRALLKMRQQPISLHSISNEERDWNDILADEEEIEKLPQESKRDITKTVLEILEPREREILMRRFGLLGHSVETLEQVAKHFGLTGERIRQLEVIALRKLRVPESNRLLDGMDPK